jgi:tetratricopeptide (TPR) repeat protein
MRLPENVRFCFSCGANVEANVEVGSKFQICETCGFENLVVDKYCISCGSRLTGKVIVDGGGGERVVDVADIWKRKETKIYRKEQRYKKVGRSKVSFMHLFYLTVGLIVVGLIGYGISIKDERKAPPVDQSRVENILDEIERLRRKVEENPDDMQSTLILANLLHDSHLFEQAILYYSRYLSVNEEDVNARVDMAICLFEIGRSDEAIEEIEKALKYDPNHQLAYYNLGVIYLGKGEIQKANEYFRKCINIDPDSRAARQARQIMEQHQF